MCSVTNFSISVAPLRSTACLPKAFLLAFGTVDKLVGADCLATLRLIGIYLLVDIAKIECRHAQIRRLLLAGNVGRNRHISWASAMWMLGICRRLALVSAFRAERRRPRGRTNKTPKKNYRVRKAPKQRQRPYRGAGLRRALLSTFLASLEGRALNKKGNRKEALKAAHQHAIAVQQQGGPPLEEAAHRGRARRPLLSCNAAARSAELPPPRWCREGGAC